MAYDERRHYQSASAARRRAKKDGGGVVFNEIDAHGRPFWTVMVTVKSPHAKALASPLFRKRIKPSGKQYKRKPRTNKA